jgi:Holliday junction resolvasome RuvABC DNA-binding subunit
MDIMAQLKDKIDDIVEKVKSDKNVADKFQKDPISTVESLIGIDLPNDQIENVVEAVKAKINVDKLGGMLGGLFGKK